MIVRRPVLLFLTLLTLACYGFDSAVGDLDHRDTNKRLRAIDRLRELGDPRAVDPLLNVLATESSDLVKGYAAQALGDFKDPRTIPSLVRCLSEASPGIGQDRPLLAARALGRIGAPAFDPVMAAFRGQDGKLHAGAAAALGEIRDRRAVEPLLQTLAASNDPTLRAAIITALGTLGDPRAYAALNAAQGSADWQVRGAAEKSLALLEGAGANLIASLKSENESDRERAATALGGSDDAAAPEALRAALRDPAPAVRRAAAKSLSSIASRKGAPWFDDAARDVAVLLEDSQTREAAASTLNMLGPGGAKQLAAALRSNDDQVRLVVAGAFNGYVPSSIRTDAIRSLDDPSTGVRFALARSLAQSAKEDYAVADALDQALKEKRLDIVAGGYDYYLRKGSSSSVPVLVEALMSHGDYSMASAMLHCGNAELAKAAIRWAPEHGYKVEEDWTRGQLRSKDAAKWGGGG